MAYPKGRPNPNAGRPKGSLDKVTIEFKAAVTNLINFATPQLIGWLQDVAAEDPNKALDHVYRFAQFGYPLLARVENENKNQSVTNINIMQFSNTPEAVEAISDLRRLKKSDSVIENLNSTPVKDD